MSHTLPQGAHEYSAPKTFSQPNHQFLESRTSCYTYSEHLRGDSSQPFPFYWSLREP